MELLSKGELDILKIRTVEAFLVKLFFGKLWFEIIGLLYFFLGFQPIKLTFFYVIIWNKPILCILCCINNYSKDFSKKMKLAILWPSHYWKMDVIFSKALFQKAISRSIFVRFWKTWYHYDRKREIFNLSTKPFLSGILF